MVLQNSSHDQLFSEIRFKMYSYSPSQYRSLILSFKIMFVKLVNSVNSCKRRNCKLLFRKHLSLLFISVKDAYLCRRGMVSLHRASYV